jgi:hypothetical protein
VYLIHAGGHILHVKHLNVVFANHHFSARRRALNKPFGVDQRKGDGETSKMEHARTFDGTSTK